MEKLNCFIGLEKVDCWFIKDADELSELLTMQYVKLDFITNNKIYFSAKVNNIISFYYSSCIFNGFPCYVILNNNHYVVFSEEDFQYTDFKL